MSLRSALTISCTLRRSCTRLLPVGPWASDSCTLSSRLGLAASSPASPLFSGGRCFFSHSPYSCSLRHPLLALFLLIRLPPCFSRGHVLCFASIGSPLRVASPNLEFLSILLWACSTRGMRVFSPPRAPHFVVFIPPAAPLRLPVSSCLPAVDALGYLMHLSLSFCPPAPIVALTCFLCWDFRLPGLAPPVTGAFFSQFVVLSLPSAWIAYSRLFSLWPSVLSHAFLLLFPRFPLSDLLALILPLVPASALPCPFVSFPHFLSSLSSCSPFSLFLTTRSPRALCLSRLCSYSPFSSLCPVLPLMTILLPLPTYSGAVFRDALLLTSRMSCCICCLLACDASVARASSSLSVHPAFSSRVHFFSSVPALSASAPALVAHFPRSSPSFTG